MSSPDFSNSRYAVAFEPDIGRRPYAEIAAKLSVPAQHLLSLLFEL